MSSRYITFDLGRRDQAEFAALSKPEDVARDFAAAIFEFFVDQDGVVSRKRHDCTMYDLIYGSEVDAMSSRPQPSFRWIHIPHNWIIWVKKIMTKTDFGMDFSAFEYYCAFYQTQCRAMGLATMSPTCQPLPGEFPASRDELYSKFMVFMPMFGLNCHPQSDDASNVGNCCCAGALLQSRLQFWHLNYYTQTGGQNLYTSTGQTLGQYLNCNGLYRSYLEQNEIDGRRRTRDEENIGQNADPFDLEVDRLWLWNDSHTVITAFPSFPTGSQSLLDKILCFLEKPTQAPMKTITNLIMCIIRQGSGISMFHTLYNDQLLNVFEYLNRAISTIRDDHSILQNQFEELWKDLKSIELPDPEYTHSFNLQEYVKKTDQMFIAQTTDKKIFGQINPSSWNTNGEILLISQIDNLELQVSHITALMNDQSTLVKKFVKFIFRQQKLQGESDEEAYERVLEEVHYDISRSLIELGRLDFQASRAREKIDYLISIKNSLRTRWESDMNLDMATSAAKQNQAILIFTIFTMIFLPSSFIAAVFTIPIREFPSSASGSISLPLSYVVKNMSTFTVAVVVPSIVIAFNLQRLSRWKDRIIAISPMTQNVSSRISLMKRSIWKKLRGKKYIDQEAGREEDICPHMHEEGVLVDPPEPIGPTQLPDPSRRSGRSPLVVSLEQQVAAASSQTGAYSQQDESSRLDRSSLQVGDSPQIGFRLPPELLRQMAAFIATLPSRPPVSSSDQVGSVQAEDSVQAESSVQAEGSSHPGGKSQVTAFSQQETSSQPEAALQTDNTVEPNDTSQADSPTDAADISLDSIVN
ncbi:hypothetical protein BT63DRAFT_185181 [Microthyrium microscopicum]|uniref:Cora-domain-containing protein n=1 Tax=Microthyrium microscopicum TaxID=703497 RepID=A0A6A6UM40_9PEZI|nr:hypothetical protein BT63DRAFT_185181 [Microthyrium microscopicum]